MAEVRFAGATKLFPGVIAVNALDLEVADGEFMVLVGPSGSGKSTALRMVAGLEGVDEGSIYIGEREVTKLAPKDRDIAMVFQNYALYPHMTVEENIGFHLKVRRRPKDEVAAKVAEVIRLLELEGLLDRKPAQLSGGQRQRVAMGRAIVREPQVFLLDEPLSNLDAKLRAQTRAHIASLQRRLGVTTIFVTHDQVEAMTMGDRVAVLHDGVLQQCDEPRRLYETPANAFVAGFIGSPAMNLLTLSAGEDGVLLGGVLVPIPPAQRAALNGGLVTLGIRPEGFEVVPPEDGLRAVIEAVEELGAEAYVFASAKVGQEPTLLTVRWEKEHRPARGEEIGLLPKPGRVHLFSVETGLRLPGDVSPASVR